MWTTNWHWVALWGHVMGLRSISNFWKTTKFSKAKPEVDFVWGEGGVMQQVAVWHPPVSHNIHFEVTKLEWMLCEGGATASSVAGGNNNKIYPHCNSCAKRDKKLSATHVLAKLYKIPGENGKSRTRPFLRQKIGQSYACKLQPGFNIEPIHFNSFNLLCDMSVLWSTEKQKPCKKWTRGRNMGNGKIQSHHRHKMIMMPLSSSRI